MCPVSAPEKMTGTFGLEPLAPSPLFTRYRVTDVSWKIVGPNAKTVHRIAGQGIYEIGGEVALMQQLILNLSIDGASPQLFVSGLVPFELPFPAISLSVDNGGKCYEISLHINADTD